MNLLYIEIEFFNFLEFEFSLLCLFLFVKILNLVNKLIGQFVTPFSFLFERFLNFFLDFLEFGNEIIGKHLVELENISWNFLRSRETRGSSTLFCL